MSRGWFITGTDTDCGKTWVATRLLMALCEYGTAVGFKPVAAGCHKTKQGWRNDDALQLQAASFPLPSYQQVNPVALADAIAPHIAAKRQGLDLSASHLLAAYEALQGDYEFSVVEGAGGWRVPLNEDEFLSDLPKRLNMPVLLVVGLKLGCLNHALLSAEAILADGCCLAGWISNAIDPHMAARSENLNTLQQQLSERLGVPQIAHFDYEAGLKVPECQVDVTALLREKPYK